LIELSEEMGVAQENECICSGMKGNEVIKEKYKSGGDEKKREKEKWSAKACFYVQTEWVFLLIQRIQRGRGESMCNTGRESGEDPKGR
jgi:hypothetical protein